MLWRSHGSGGARVGGRGHAGGGWGAGVYSQLTVIIQLLWRPAWRASCEGRTDPRRDTVEGIKSIAMDKHKHIAPDTRFDSCSARRWRSNRRFDYWLKPIAAAAAAAAVVAQLSR